MDNLLAEAAKLLAAQNNYLRPETVLYSSSGAQFSYLWGRTQLAQGASTEAP